jgi:hypothetical protein
MYSTTSVQHANDFVCWLIHTTSSLPRILVDTTLPLNALPSPSQLRNPFRWIALHRPSREAQGRRFDEVSGRRDWHSASGRLRRSCRIDCCICQFQSGQVGVRLPGVPLLISTFSRTASSSVLAHLPRACQLWSRSMASLSLHISCSGSSSCCWSPGFARISLPLWQSSTIGTLVKCSVIDVL